MQHSEIFPQSPEQVTRPKYLSALDVVHALADNGHEDVSDALFGLIDSIHGHGLRTAESDALELLNTIDLNELDATVARHITQAANYARQIHDEFLADHVAETQKTIELFEGSIFLLHDNQKEAIVGCDIQERDGVKRLKIITDHGHDTPVNRNRVLIDQNKLPAVFKADVARYSAELEL